MSRPMPVIVACALAVALGAACARGGASTPAARTDEPPPTAPGRINPDAEAMVAFQERIKAYIQLRATARKALPPLAGDATPEQLHAHQLALAAGIREARRTAKPGDVFEPDAQRVIRGLMARIFAGADGAQLKADIMDENPGRIRIGVNDRYPDGVPLSMVPPPVLAGLPKLPAELEYRFLGRALILLDTEAQLIVDVMDNAIP
jgi:hypothetical protein